MEKIVNIDGSTLEGGGQILRTALALSAVLQKPVKITRIRAKRKNPGLGRQHLAGVQLVARMCNARMDPEPRLGTTELLFSPGAIKGGEYEGGVSTAGSIGLMIQIALPVALFARESCVLRLRGGTHTFFSPPVDYIERIIVPILRKMGADIEIRTIRRGYYPRGGGVVEVKTRPLSGPLSGLKFLGKEIEKIRGIARVDNLPRHIAERERIAAERILRKTGYDVDIEIVEGHENVGTYILLWTEGERILGSDELGKKRVPAERVGANAASKLVSWIERGYTLDPHAGDWLMIYAALASGSTEYITEPTLHIKTCKYVIETLIEREVILINGERIFANGIGYGGDENGI